MKTLKNSKKLLAVILILAFLLNVCVTVNANTTGAKHKITIKGAGSGHVYEVYQVFTGNLKEGTSELGDVKWGEGVNQSGLLTALKASETMINERTFDADGITASPTGNQKQFGSIFEGCSEAYEVAHALSPYENSSDVIREFAQIVGQNLNEGTGVTAKAEGSNYTVDNLDTGYYFIKDTQSVVSEAQTRYILNLVKDCEISVKADAPTMEIKVAEGEDKYVEASDFQIGDTITFHRSNTY